jgi:hypothetical protein
MGALPLDRPRPLIIDKYDTAPSAEADIAETEIYGMKASHLKVVIAWQRGLSSE